MENVLTAAPQTVQQKARRRLKHTDPSKNLIPSTVSQDPQLSLTPLAVETCALQEQRCLSLENGASKWANAAVLVSSDSGLRRRLA